MRIARGVIYNETDLVRSLGGKRPISGAALFDQLLDAAKAGRRAAFLASLTRYEFDVLCEALTTPKGERV
ncbi:MAG: hypothetical protein AB1346_00460 [Thermodesulfobacteriota bacterium]